MIDKKFKNPENAKQPDVVFVVKKPHPSKPGVYLCQPEDYSPPAGEEPSFQEYDADFIEAHVVE